MQTHFLSRNLKGAEKPDRDVQVMFAVKPGTKAVLFIHGFSGNAITTWSDFHELLPECGACASRDLYFYGYDGLRAEMTASASLFREFLKRMFENTSDFLEKNLPPLVERARSFQ